MLGDHLDVIGHFAGGLDGGVTVFESGANFDTPRLTELWRRIGAAL